VKSAVTDVFEENRELMQDIVQEAPKEIEDIAVARTIEQGLKTKSVSPKEVFSVLGS
jgi:hypothetical protein